MWVEGPIRDVAGRQYGLVHRQQLLALDVSTHEIARRLGNGRLEQLHPGVYYLDAVAATWKTAVLAGVMAAGPDAIASHRTAAVLWDLDAIYGRMIEVTVPFNDQPEPENVILHRTRRANPVTNLDGIPVTPLPKNLLDIAPFVPERTLLKAARSGVRKELTTVEEMDEAVGLYGGRGVSGTRKYRRVIRAVTDDLSGSVSEIDLKNIVICHALSSSYRFCRTEPTPIPTSPGPIGCASSRPTVSKPMGRLSSCSTTCGDRIS